MNELHTQLTLILASGKEIIFFHEGLVIFMQPHSEEGFEFDIGERDDNETTSHYDGGVFSGKATDAIALATDAIVFVTKLAEAINDEFANVIAANDAHERDENRGRA